MQALLAMPSGAEWIIVLAIVVLLFGAKKLPDLARNSGKALTEFKKETKDLRGEKKDESTAELTQGTQAPEQPLHPPVQAPSQQPAPQSVQPPVQSPNPQAPGDGTPPSSN